MKINILTCHNVYNYGASLQAYALQHYLENKNHHVEIIDYLPDYKKVYKLIIPEKGKTASLIKKFPFLKIPLIFFHNRHKIKLLPKKRYFDNFTKNKLHLTKKKYKNFEELRCFPPQNDLIIAGSDQIWNIKHGNGLDPAFYLLFENNSDKCISYSASFGISEVPKKYKTFVANSLEHFRAISVREQTGKKILEEFNIKSTVTLDPVFLINKYEWEALCSPQKINKKYLLVYDFKLNDPEIEKLVKFIANKNNLKIFAIYSDPHYADRILKKVGPIEFLSLIKDAEFIITTSFHATIFSIIFQKEFYTFGQKGEGNSSRMIDFLSNIGLENRFLSLAYDGMSDSSINYDEVNRKINILKRDSINWLRQNINFKCVD